MTNEPTEKEAKYLYEIESLKKDETDIGQVLLDIQNHLNDEEKFEYDRTILDKKNFIVTPNSIERIRKISYYISRGVPVLLEGPSGTSKTFSTEFSCLVAKTKRPLIRFNMSSDTVPADLLGKMVGDKNSLAGISSQEGHFLKAFKYGHPLLLDEINLASQAVLQCIEEALDSEVISIEIPGFPLTIIRKHPDFALIATQNPNKGLFANKRQNLGKKFMSKFQVITFPEFTEDELNKIAIGLANNFKFKGDKKILEDLVKFHKKWASSDDIKDDVQCFTVREIAASVKAFSEGSNIYDTVMTIYGARYQKTLKEKLEKLLKSYPSFANVQPDELTIPPNFPDCFKNKSLLEAIKSIKFSLDNNRHVIISGNEGSGKTQLALWFAEWYSKERDIKKSNIFYCLCTEELKCPDLIGRQSPTNSSDPGKELIEWKNGFLSNAIENGGVVVLDALDQASATVTERLNGLLDQKYDDTEKAKFDVPENPQKPEIIIHKNFRLVCTTDIHKINQMSPAFVNRFDVIVLEDQLESIKEDEKKELIKFLLINSYKENKVKNIISKQEEIQEKEKEPEINEELLKYDFNAVQDEQKNEQMDQGEGENQEQDNQNFEENNDNMNEGEENFANEFREGNEDYLNFDKAGETEDFNFGKPEGGGEGEGEGEGANDEIPPNNEGEEPQGENNMQIEENNEPPNNDNNENNQEDNKGKDENQEIDPNKRDNATDENNKNENPEENKKPKEENNETEEKEIEETYVPTNELIDLVYSKSGDFKTIYKLNQFCRTIRIFLIYFKDKENITQNSIVDFCYNILTKDFEKGKLIEIAPEIEKILLDLRDEPDSDDPKYFYKNSKLLSNYIAILHACKIANIHLCVYGPPGAGKTSGTRAFGRIISKDPTKRFDFEMHSFHAGTKPSHYYGTTTLKEGKICYKNGTLTNSLINGYMFIADELNLSSVSNMNALAPALEMNLNISINFPGIEKPILIHPNFFFVVCQNEVGTIGRNTLPPNIIKRFKEIFYPPQQVEDIAQICKEINNSFYQPGDDKIIKEDQAGKLGEYMIKLNSNNFSEISQWSLRDINKLFQRQIQQFKLPGVYNGITFCHNLLFYTMSSVSKEDIPNVKEKVIKIIQEVFDLSIDERNNISECFNSKAELKNDSHGFLCIFKGSCSISFDLFKQIFITADKPNIEENPIMKLTSLLEDLFQISLTSDKEPILLIGPSGYKTFLAQKFLSNAKTITLNQESSVEQLLGSSAFFSKSEVNDFYLRLIVLICRINNYKDLNQKLRDGTLKKEEIEDIIEKKKIDLPFSFIYALDRCKERIFAKKKEDDEANALSNMIIEFRPGLFLTAILGGSCLILKNLSNLPTIILERFNELFSGKCNITVNEDIPNTITPESNKELSDFNKNFRVFGTCPPGATSQLSEAVISRFSLIYVGEYAPNEQKTVLQSYCDLNNLNTITDNNIDNIIECSQSLNTSFSGINMTLFQMINLLQLAHNINQKLNKSGKYSFMTKDVVLSLIIYYSARGLLDNRESKQLQRLCDIIGLNAPPEEAIEKMVTPLYLDEEEGVKGIRSKITKLIIKSPHVEEKEKDIAFTHQFNEMVEIIHFGLANNVPVILEGMPGQGKQLCINYIAELLGYEVINIMISQSTKVEDLLGKNIITKDKNKNIKVILNETKLSKALKKQNDNNQNGKELIFVFNNLNNASPAVLELLTSIFDKNQENVLLSDGSTIPKNPINIIGILKPQNGANRDKLPPTLLYSSLYHIVLEPDENSIKQIIEKKLEKEKFKSDNIKLFNNYMKAKDIIEKKYQKENFLNLNDITKFINFRKISYGKIDDVDIIFAMVFVYRFTEEEIIEDLKKELHIQSIDMKPSLIYDMPIGTLTYAIGEKNKIQIKTYFKAPLTNDEITNLKNVFISLTSNQKSCILFLILCALTKRACIIQGETASGKSHVIRTFALLVGKNLNVYQLNSESSTSLLTGQSTLNTKITKDESEELNKIFETLEIFEQIKDKINDKFPKDKYEEWSAESFKELIELIKDVEQRGTAEDKEILRKARIEIGKIIIPANRFNNDCDSAFVISLKNGSWDLFDGMESSPPQLAEKISTLAGEEPELDLYETGKDNYFFTRKKDIPNSTLIHEDFLMFICHNISSQSDKSLDPSLLSKCNCFCMPPVDSKEIDSAQMLYGSFIKNGLERKICQSSATRFSFVHKFVKDKAKIEEDSFSGDFQPTGRTLGFIGKEFHKYYENINTDFNLQLYKPICHSLVSFYANSYNPTIKEEEGKKGMTENEKTAKEIILKKEFVDNLIKKFKNYVPDFTLDEVPQSEKYLDILSFLKSIQEFAVFGKPKNAFNFDFKQFIISSIDKIELGDLDLIIKHLSDTVTLLSKMKIPEKDKDKILKEKDLYYQIHLYNEILKDIQKQKNLVSDQYIGRKLSDKELLQIEELKVPLSRLHLYEGFIKNNEIFSGNVKSCLFEKNLTDLTSHIGDLYYTKNMLSFQKLLGVLKLNTHLFKVMDLIFPYRHFSNNINIHNIAFLINLFTKLYLAEINFKVIVDKKEFLFQSSDKSMRLICYFNISAKFLIDINSRFERILKKGDKSTVLYKILPQFIKDPNKDFIANNNYMYKTALTIIEKKMEDTINSKEILKLITDCQKDKNNITLKLDKSQEPFYISRFINISDKSSLFGKCWGLVLNFNEMFLKYIKVFCNTIEKHLITLADILNKIIEPMYIEPILNLCESMKEFSNSNSILWQIITGQFKPEPSKANIYNESIKKEKAIVDNVFNQEIQFNENIKADFQNCFGEAQKEIDKLILIDVKDEKERKIKQKLQENKTKLNSVKTNDNKIKIVKNQLSAYITQYSENTSLLDEEVVNDITEKVNHFIELSKQKEIIKEENLIDWPDSLVKQPVPNETDNTIRLDLLLWYSKIMKEIKIIDSDVKNNLLKSVMKLNENNEILPIINLLMNMNDGKITDIDKKNKQIIFGTLNAIFIYKLYKKEKTGFLWDLGEYINNFIKREEINDSYFISLVDDNIKSLEDKFWLYVPKFKKSDILFLFINVTKNDYQGNRDYKLGPLLDEFRCMQVISGLIPMVDKLLSSENTKTMVEIMDDITKVIYLNYLNSEGKEEELKSHDSIIECLKNVKPMCTKKIEELKNIGRDKSNEIFTQENKIKCSEIILSVIDLAKLMDSKFPEYNLEFNDLDFFNEKMDEEFINTYPTLFYFFNKNMLTFQQLKDNFIVAYKNKKLYDDQNEFYHAFYFWIFGLRILSSINCINLEQYNDIFNEYSSNEVKKIMKDKMNRKEKFGTKWINILLDNIDPIYEDSYILSIYKYVKKIIGYTSNVKTEFKEESISLLKKVLLYLIKHVFDDSINDFLQKDFSNIDKLIEFFKNPDSQLKLEIENDVTAKYNEIIESELYVRELKPFYNSLITDFPNLKSEIETESSNEKKFTENQFIQEREKERANSIEDKTFKMKKLIKEYQDSFDELKDKLDNSIILKFNNSIRKINTFVNKNASVDELIKNNEQIVLELNNMNDLLEQENNNELLTMIKDLEEINDKLIKVKYYQKYKNIRTKFDSKSFSYSGLKDLDKFAKVIEESINIFEQYEFPEDIELKEFMNKKQDDLKENLQLVNDIQTLVDNFSIDSRAKKYLNDSNKFLEESKKIEKEKNTIMEKIEIIKEENEKKQTEIDSLQINIEEIKKECGISEDEKNEIETKIKEMKEQKEEKEKKDKEKADLKKEAKENIANLEAQIEDLNKKISDLYELQGDNQGIENVQNEYNNQEGNEKFNENGEINPENAGEENPQNENNGHEEGNEDIDNNKKNKTKEEKMDEYIKEIEKLREEKTKYEAILEIDDTDITSEGIDLVAIDESLNELESKIEAYNDTFLKIGEINAKINDINDKINSNKKSIEKLEKELSQKEKELFEANKKYEQNKTLSEKELEKKKDIDINDTIMKDKELNITNLKEEASNLRVIFKNHQEKIKSFLDSKKNKIYREFNNPAQVVTPSYCFENIQKKCKDLFLKEYNDFSNIYSKIYDIKYKFSNLFTKESSEILFSNEKLDTFFVSYSYPESNSQDKVCFISDKHGNSIPIKIKKSGYIFLNPNIYEKNNKTIAFHQYQYESRKNVRNKSLILKPIDIDYEIKLSEFYKIDDTKIDEAMEKNLEEIKQYDYKKDCPNLQFGIGQNLKNENEFFQMLDKYYIKAKDIEKIFNIFEDDKNNKSIDGIKSIVGDIDKMINDLYSITNQVKNHCKVEFTNTLYKCLGTQGKIDDLNNKISQLEEYIKKLLNLINSKNLIIKVNKLKTIKDDYEFFNKNLRLFLPEEKPSNKTVDFSKLNEKSDLLKLPIISIVNNVVTCSYPNLKLSFGPYIASLYKEPIKINFTSLVKTLSMSIKDIENQYRSLLKCYVNNSNGLAQLEITIPKMANEEKDKEIISIKCKIEFNSPGAGSCLLDCEFNIEIIPFNAIIYCKEYEIAKKSEDTYALCLTQTAAGTPIHFCVGNYNIDKELKYTYQLESLENNLSEKPEIQKKKGILELVLGNKDEKTIKRLVCQLIINFSDSMYIKINIDCYLIPFDFKFEIYDYNSKIFSDSLDVYLRGKYDFGKHKSSIKPNLIPLHFQVIFPNYSYKGKIDIFYSKYSNYIKIKNSNNIPKNFDKPFTFDLDLEIDGDIFKYYESSYRSELRESLFTITLKIFNISNCVNINFKLINRFIRNEYPDSSYINTFVMEKYSFNNGDKWEPITKRQLCSGNYVTPYELESSVLISYKNYDDYKRKWYLEAQTSLKNKLLLIKNTKIFLWWGTEINFVLEEVKSYFYDNNYNIAIIGNLNNSKDLWYPAFSSYDAIYSPKLNKNYNNYYKSLLKLINSHYKDSVTKGQVISDFSVLTYVLSVLGSEWKYSDKKYLLNIFLESIFEVLDKNYYKELVDIYKSIQKPSIPEESLNKAYYDTIISLYKIFKDRYNFIRSHHFSIISIYLSEEKIKKKSEELMNKYFSYKDTLALEKKYILNSFPKINKGIYDANEMLKHLPKTKKKAIIYKEGGKSLLSDKTDTNFSLSASSLNKGEDLSKISTFKAELIQDIIYPPKWSIFSLNDFFMKSIKLTRELPLFAISAKLENNIQSLNKTEKLYIKLLDLFETTPQKDESFIGELVLTFNDQFTKMTNNLIFSNIMFKEGILPKKLKTNTDKLGQSNKQYIIVPKEINLNEPNEKQWESNFIKENKTVKKNDLDTSKYMKTNLFISKDTIQGVSKNLLEQKEKLKREEEERKRREQQKLLLERQKTLSENNKDNNINKEEEKIPQPEEEQKPEQKPKKEDLVSSFNIKFKKNRKSSKDEILNLNKNNSNNAINNDSNKDMEVNTDTSVKKENIKIDVTNFNFNDELLLRLVIERMKEIEDKIKNNKNLPEIGIKKDLKGQPDYRNEKPSSQNFNIGDLYQRGMSLANKIIKDLSEKSIPFSHTSVNLLLDCSGFISIENKLKQFVIVCGIVNALNIVNINYAISIVGDSQFECTLKPFDVEHSMEYLQKVLDCLFIKRFIGKNANAIQYALKFTKANSLYRTILIFSDGLDEDFLLTDAWKAKLFTNPNYSFGFFFINSENICNKHTEDLDYLKVKWDDFKKSVRDSGININLMYYKSTFEDSNKLYDDISNVVSNLLERPIDEGKIPNKDDSLFNFPIFDLSHEENLDSFQNFENSLKQSFEDRPDIYIKKTEVLKNIANKVTKLNVNPYKNKLSKIVKYDIKEEIKSEIHSYAKRFIENRAKLNKAKIEAIFKPNKPSQKVLSTTGTEFDIPALIMNLINPSPDPMIYLEEKGGMIRNYSVSLILDTSYSCFNPLCTAFSLQTLRLMLSTLTSIDLPSFDFILSRQKEPEILCSNLSSVRAINPKSSLWESLLSILAHPCSKSDLASAIEAAFDLKRMRSSEYTSYLFILTDGLYQENEYKRILRAVSNCVKSGLNVFGIGIGIYPVRIEYLFPKVIYCHNPYNLNKAIANFFGESISGVKDSMNFVDIAELNHEIELNNSIAKIINESTNLTFNNLKNKLSEVIVETDAFLLISNQEDDMEDTNNNINSNPTGEGKELLKKDALKGQKILIVMLWSKTLNPDENESVHKDYLTKVSPESEACLKDAFDHLGIIIDIVENYRNAIEKITSKNDQGKCPYYAVWIINGPPYEDLPDGTKEAFLFGQFLEVLKLFWEKGGALVFLAEGWKLQYQTNEFLKMLDFDGKKIEFYLVGDDEDKGTKEHVGGKILTGDKTGLLKNKQEFSKKIERYSGLQRLRLDHNLFKLFEGDTICYTSTDDYEKLLPFHPFSRDSENGISSLFYLSDEKKRGDIFIDCGFTKLFLNMKKEDTAFRYFQNIASWSARTEIHLMYDGIDARDWRPEGIDYTIDVNKKWSNFLQKPTGFKKIDLSKLSTLFAFDNSGSISGNSIYFNEIARIVKKYYKSGDKFYLWGDTYTEQSKSQIDQWIRKMDGPEGTYSINIAKLAIACPSHREHLIIVTDGGVSERDIRESDNLMQKYNIQFKFVSVYIVGRGGNLSVGAPYCRGCPNRSIHVLDAKNRIKGPSLSLDEIKAFDQLPSINSINQFNNLYDKLYSAIKAKQLGKNGDNNLMSKLNALKSRIINTISGQQKTDFEKKWNELYEMASKGVHDFKIGTAGIKKTK